MGIVVKLDGVTLSAPAWLVPGPELSAGQAADGTTASSRLVIDDASGALRVRGWQAVSIDEPACVDAPRLFTGYIGQRTYSRGSYRDGPGRFITCELIDLNTLLTMRLLTGGDVVRPEESDTDRLAWLIGSGYLDGLVQDLGLVNGTGLLFDKANYHGSYASDVLRDMTTTYDQIWFVYWDQVAEAAGLFFDFPDANTNVCDLSISNDMTDVDYDTIWPPLVDAELVTDPVEVYSNVRFVYTGGVVYLSKQATADEFFTDNDLLRRGVQVEQTKIGKQSTALTFAQRFLDASDHERQAITVTVQLPASLVNKMDAGQLIPCKFTHMPDYGFDDFVNMRIQSRTVVQAGTYRPDLVEGELETLYNVTLTLALTGVHSIGSGGGSTTPSPQQPPTTNVVELCIPSNANISGTSITVANGQYVYVEGIDIDVTLLGTSGWHLWLDSSGATDPDTGPAGFLPILTFQNGYPGTPTNIGSWNSPDLTGDAGMHAGGAGGPGFSQPNQEGIGVFRRSAGVSIYDPDFVYFGFLTVSAGPSGINVSNSGNINAGTWFLRGGNGDGDGYFSEPGYSGCIRVSVSDLAPLDFWNNSPTTTTEPPLYGQWSPWTVIDMTGPDGDLGFVYIAGSLQVKVDGVLINPSAYDEDDDGTFTLHWTPDADETVTARAQGA